MVGLIDIAPATEIVQAQGSQSLSMACRPRALHLLAGFPNCANS